MFNHKERPATGPRSRLASAALTVIVAACLATAGCSGAAPGTLLGSHKTAATPTTIAPHNPLTGPPADPFAGTPADHWADGAAGIVLPTARPVGPWTTAQVESAYQTTRKLLIAANLDQQTLLGGRPNAFGNLLTNAEKTWFFQNLDKQVSDENGVKLTSRSMVVSFAPGSTQLVGNVIKVKGTMTAQAATLKGLPELDVHADYLFVYPVEPPGHPNEWMRVVSERGWTVSFANWRDAASPFEPLVTVTNSDSDSGVLCGTGDGYQHPGYSGSPQPTASPTGSLIDPYVPGQDMGRSCRRTTGT